MLCVVYISASITAAENHVKFPHIRRKAAA